ncbi:hypothetical protein SAMN05421768_11613 [Chryseobacterium joostei]|uniref:Outer membrane protein beta-barrel domain-containing protein n=1 Tax=Chryseobacterium joostei TaxID=112234 RepID=A0A1N7KNB2_9FLAO|nr:hypothetical protein [Chryseobacterium joostei]SIS63034.1 hypothetical protein SAMN05421768_11613 [Chryseobacterium joostei]
MKFTFTILLLAMYACLYGQSLEYTFNVGTGATYLVENYDRSININYKTPVSISTDLKFTPKNSNFGILLRYQFTGTGVDGSKWFDEFSPSFKAQVNDNSFILLIEYLKKSDKKINFGANFGLGYTKQIISLENENYTRRNVFPSLHIGGIISCKINSKLSVKLQPGFQFFDPLNALSKNNYHFAKEDIHFLTQVGFSYLFSL